MPPTPPLFPRQLPADKDALLDLLDPEKGEESQSRVRFLAKCLMEERTHRYGKLPAAPRWPAGARPYYHEITRLAFMGHERASDLLTAIDNLSDTMEKDREKLREVDATGSFAQRFEEAAAKKKLAFLNDRETIAQDEAPMTRKDFDKQMERYRQLGRDFATFLDDFRGQLTQEPAYLEDFIPNTKDTAATLIAACDKHKLSLSASERKNLPTMGVAELTGVLCKQLKSRPEIIIELFEPHELAMQMFETRRELLRQSPTGPVR